MTTLRKTVVPLTPDYKQEALDAALLRIFRVEGMAGVEGRVQAARERLARDNADLMAADGWIT